MIAANTMSNQMREDIRNDPTMPIKRVYNDVCHRAAGHVDEDDVPEFHSVRSAMSRTRSSVLPDIPETVDDVVIEEEWARTWEGQDFLSHLDNDWGIAVFATSRNFQRLQRCQTIFIDGTFKTCPPPYAQLVTIHGMYHGRVLPFVLALMTGKEVGQYRQVLQHVKRKVRQVTGHRFRPRLVISDFEQSIQIAVQTELRHSRISSCYFHFCKNLWKKITDLGLSRAYKRNRRLKKTLRKFMAIAYLPLRLVRHNFRLLVASRRTRRLINRYPSLMDFILYLERNYVLGQFPVATWNVYDRDIDTRTNNHVEGLYSFLLIQYKNGLYWTI